MNDSTKKTTTKTWTPADFADPNSPAWEAALELRRAQIRNTTKKPDAKTKKMRVHRDFLIRVLEERPELVSGLFSGQYLTAAEAIADIRADTREWFGGDDEADNGPEFLGEVRRTIEALESRGESLSATKIIETVIDAHVGKEIKDRNENLNWIRGQLQDCVRLLRPELDEA